MIIKVCGLRNSENIRQVADLGVDWMGLVFNSRSPRNVTMLSTHAGIIPDRGSLSVHTTPLKAGVFTDEMPQNIITRVVNFKLDIIQLNGQESPILIRNLQRTLEPDIRQGVKYIKALSINSREDVKGYVQYDDCVDYFLFDTPDWTLLDAYDGQKPFLLGGLTPDDAPRFLQWLGDEHHPVTGKCLGIDLGSPFESEPGIIDIDVLTRFIEQLSTGK